MADSGTNGGPRYCQHCGTAVAPGNSFCPDCGGDLARTRTRPAGEGRALWQRVNEYLSRDWRVESNAGDRVVLVNRSVGSLGAHAVLLLPTGGLGNVLYGWYEYAHNSDRLVLSADGPDHAPGRGRGRQRATGGRASRRQAPRQRREPTVLDRLEDYLTAPLSQFVAGIGLLVGGLLLAAGSGSFAPLLVGLATVVVATLVLPPTRRRLADRHPPTTFGPTASVDERYVADTDQSCTVCRGRVDEGVVRNYQKEYTLAGVPLYTIEASENYYCESCHVAGETAVDTLSAAPWTDAPDAETLDGDPDSERE